MQSTLPSDAASKHFGNQQPDDGAGRRKYGFRNFLSFVGPGFLVSLAYLDPGNVATDLQAGASHGYSLLWVILIGLIFALIIQSLAANLGVSTRKHLAEVCKVEYPVFVRYCLWFFAELAVISADIPEVVGTAFGLNILFHIPLWVGVLITGLTTLIFLSLQKYGVRKLEFFITILIFIMAGCFFGELSYVKPPATGVLEGMFVPKLNGQGATADAIALFGALIMPHNLFLHSALVLSRKVPNNVRGINEACKYFLIESGIALFIAFLINIAIVAVAGAVCTVQNITPQISDQCSNITLQSASFLLKNVLGKSSSTVYAIALLASGQSSAITGTFAGQFIMEGFLDLKMQPWIRNLLTRTIAIVPSLIVSSLSGPRGAGRLIIISQMILSFELPFALIPLLKFSSGATKMGPHKNSIYIIVLSWILGFGIIGINVYYLITAYLHWFLHNSLPKVANVFTAIVVFPLIAVYIIAVIYLTFRKDVTTFVDPVKEGRDEEVEMENGEASPSPIY